MLRHLAEQLLALQGLDPEAFIAISAIIEEEQQHHDQSVSHGADGFWRRLLTPVVSASTESVIWLGMRL